MGLNFNDTAKAFAYKSDLQLKRAKFLFQLMQFSPLVSIGSIITPWAIKIGLPIKWIIRKTLFEQFVGGESLEKTDSVVSMLDQYGVNVILDYGVEGGASDENKFENEAQKFIEVIQFASKSSNIPFISIKITGLTSLKLLEKLNHTIGKNQETNVDSVDEILRSLDPTEKKEWDALVSRTNRICETAAKHQIGVMIDAEESWIQDGIDHIAYLMMQKFNHQRTIVYNTIQLYRSDRLKHLKNHVEFVKENNFKSGLKLVRGAYMEKERKRAEKMGYPSPIQPDKQATDHDYDVAIEICLENKDWITTIVASHNEKSNQLAATLTSFKENHPDHGSTHFSQLYGMSDNLTFNLAAAGYSVSKYLPFGPVEEVIPYLMRRAQENSSVSGQTGRELELINKEYSRRKRAS
jgi:proline dehydrogenase